MERAEGVVDDVIDDVAGSRRRRLCRLRAFFDLGNAFGRQADDCQELLVDLPRISTRISLKI